MTAAHAAVETGFSGAAGSEGSRSTEIAADSKGQSDNAGSQRHSHSLGFTWTSAQTFIVFDGENAQAFDAEGTDLGAVSQPGCAAPRTSSSEVDNQGRVLGYDDKGQIGVVSSDGQAFGCQ